VTCQLIWMEQQSSQKQWSCPHIPTTFKESDQKSVRISIFGSKRETRLNRSKAAGYRPVLKRRYERYDDMPDYKATVSEPWVTK
jgi:hypothetical protein